MCFWGFLEKKAPEFYFLHPESLIPENICAQLKTLVQRRISDEPLSKIIGEREFFGRTFKITKDTLDPRPDTETLVDAVLHYAKDLPKPLRILDLGVGTGCILVTLLLEMKNATGVGVDLSPEALKVAADNATHFGLLERASLREGNWFSALDEKEKFSLIVSNPPYIAYHEVLEKNVQDYDPHLALFSGETGLEAYEVIAKGARQHLLAGGLIAVEFGKGQEKAVRALFEAESFEFIAYFNDLTGGIRCAIFA